jgi:hypothetical protein
VRFADWRFQIGGAPGEATCEASAEPISVAAEPRGATAAQTVVETKGVDERPLAARKEPSEDGTPRTLPESEPAVAMKNRKKIRRRGKRATDFFDPRETDFAAVVAQLDEITKTGPPRRSGRRTVN